MRKFIRGLVAATSVATLSLATSVAAAGVARSGATGTDGTPPFESFGAFLDRVSTAQYQGQGAVQSQQAFGEMRSYVLNLYQGVVVKHSYVSHDSYFDCVVTETQPSVRTLGGAKIATPPALTETTATPANSKAATQHTPGQVDAHGNAMSCSDGTIPMQRLTLERMEKFPTLKAFMSKRPASMESSTQANAHRYGVGYQWVDNYGGNSWINLWNPSGEFSLSQQWYVNGGQTVEGGWVHYSARWNPAVLFIFFTPDNYVTGCYNLECAGFVQTSSAFTLGGAWSAYSTHGGTQWGFAQQWKYWQGNWWLYIQNTAIGYYPGAIYRGGPMGSGNANLAEFGGETYTGGTNWPQMGSGNFSGAGFGWAAYQNTIFYIDRAYASRWSALSPIVTNPACYDLRITDSSVGGSWGTYVFFGGPGGFC